MSGKREASETGGTGTIEHDPRAVDTPAAGASGDDRSGEPRTTGSGSRRSGAVDRGIKRQDVVLFANQMALMVDSGVPLSEALHGLAGQSADPRFGLLLEEVTDQVDAGEGLSKVLGRYPRAFPPVMVALLRAAEASGTMGTMLTRIAQYLNRERQTAKQVRGALMYPAFMTIMCVGITVALLTLVMPRFVSIYEKKDAVLPGSTRFLMALSSGMVEHWTYCLGGALGAVVLLLLWRRTPPGRRQLDWLKLNVPVMSNLFSRLYLSRSFRTLGTMIETGVPLLDALDIVKDVTPNVHFERLWDSVDENVRRGEPLATAMHESKVVPDHFAQVIGSGEKAGRLGQVFDRVAEFCEVEFEQAVKTTTQFIEPVMIVVMGGVIGFIAISLLLPIFKMGQVVSG